MKQQNGVCHQHRKLCSFSSLVKPQAGAGQGASNSWVQEKSSQKGKQILELHTLGCALQKEDVVVFPTPLFLLSKHSSANIAESKICCEA